MHSMHNKHAQVAIAICPSAPYFNIINEFLVSDMTFHTPSLLECHKGNHPTTPLSTSMCGDRDDQKSTKSQIAFMWSGFFLSSFAVGFALVAPVQTQAGEITREITIATASNFIIPLKQIAKDFTEQTGHKVIILQGSSGALATQILHGLPVDIFLSADQARIDKIIKAKAALPKTRFTYAIGLLTLWSTDKGLIPKQAAISDIAKLLASSKINQIATANPRLAPYGLAAQQTIKALGVDKALSGKTIFGQNIAQTFTMITKGGGQIGFIARTQALQPPYNQMGSQWPVPTNLHQAIKQDGVILKSSKAKPIAHAFASFLRSISAIKTINSQGFRVKNP